jgi:hypothetical protein
MLLVLFCIKDALNEAKWVQGPATERQTHCHEKDEPLFTEGFIIRRPKTDFRHLNENKTANKYSDQH